MSDTIAQTEVLAANEAFYAAFRAGDYETMNSLWSPRVDVAVFHPGWPGIVGREDVMDSWHRIMHLGAPPDVFPRRQKVILNGSTAIVFCIEDMLAARTVASNVFVREDGAWRMTHHQAAALPDSA